MYNYYCWDRNQQTPPKKFLTTAIIKSVHVMDFINILFPEDSQLHNNRSSLHFKYHRQEQHFTQNRCETINLGFLLVHGYETVW